MRNIVDETPNEELHGRTLFSTKFVSDQDIKGKYILDIGCGFGWFELYALEKNCKRIIGLEITGEDLKTAENYIKNDKVLFRVGNSTKLPFKDNTFDTVVSWEVLEHIPKNKESDMFKEVFRVLKKGGSFYLSTPNRYFLSTFSDPAWWLMGHRHYSSNQLITLSKRNGFKIEKLIIRGGSWEIIGINNLYVSKWIFRRKPFLKNIMNKMQDRDYEKGIGFNTLFIKCKRV